MLIQLLLCLLLLSFDLSFSRSVVEEVLGALAHIDQHQESKADFLHHSVADVEHRDVEDELEQGLHGQKLLKHGCLRHLQRFESARFCVDSCEAGEENEDPTLPIERCEYVEALMISENHDK